MFPTSRNFPGNFSGNTPVPNNQQTDTALDRNANVQDNHPLVNAFSTTNPPQHARHVQSYRQLMASLTHRELLELIEPNTDKPRWPK